MSEKKLLSEAKFIPAQTVIDRALKFMELRYGMCSEFVPKSEIMSDGGVDGSFMLVKICKKFEQKLWTRGILIEEKRTWYAYKFPVDCYLI
jgi:hypothetical protein